MVGLLLNAVTLAVSVAIVIVFRIMDRDNRSLDKLNGDGSACGIDAEC